jgi:hypothetical protein
MATEKKVPEEEVQEETAAAAEETTEETAVAVENVEEEVATTTKKEEEASMAEETKSGWDETVGAFATAIGKDLTDVNTALASLVGEPGDDSLDLLLSEEDCPTADIKAALGGVPSAKLNKAVREILRPAAPAPAPGEPAAEAASAPGISAAGVSPAAVSLPAVPGDFESFISALRAGGTLKVKPGIVMSGIQVGFGNRFNLDGIVQIIEEQIIDVAERRGDPVPPVYDNFHNLAVQRKYADILAALGVAPGTTGGRKVAQKYVKEMERKVDEILFPAMRDFDTALASWVSTGMASEGSQMGLAALMQQQMTGVASPFAAFATAPADTTILVEEATRIIERVNQCFGGLGERAAAMRAHDSQQIRVAMQLPELPAALGYVDREDMLRGLFGEDLVTIADERTERSLVQWALAVLDLPNKTEGAEINGLLVGMWQLRPSIPWDRLVGTSGSRSGDNTRF